VLTIGADVEGMRDPDYEYRGGKGINEETCHRPASKQRERWSAQQHVGSERLRQEKSRCMPSNAKLGIDRTMPKDAERMKGSRHHVKDAEPPLKTASRIFAVCMQHNTDNQLRRNGLVHRKELGASTQFDLRETQSFNMYIK